MKKVEISWTEKIMVMLQFFKKFSLRIRLHVLPQSFLNSLQSRTHWSKRSHCVYHIFHLCNRPCIWLDIIWQRSRMLVADVWRTNSFVLCFWWLQLILIVCELETSFFKIILRLGSVLFLFNDLGFVVVFVVSYLLSDSADETSPILQRVGQSEKSIEIPSSSSVEELFLFIVANNKKNRAMMGQSK